MHTGFGLSMGWMWVWWLLILGAVAAFLWLTLAYARGDRRRADNAGAEEILRRRYANGEIDREEFRRRLDDLRGS